MAKQWMPELKPIRRDQLLVEARTLRDRCEISYEKLGAPAKSYQVHLNAIVTDLMMRTAQPEDPKQLKLLNAPRIGQPPSRLAKPARTAKPKDVPGLVAHRWCHKCNGYHKPGEHYDKGETTKKPAPKPAKSKAPKGRSDAGQRKRN